MLNNLTLNSGDNYPAFDESGSKFVDQLSSIGAGFTILILLVILLLWMNYIQFRRNASLVDQIISIVPTAWATYRAALRTIVVNGGSSLPTQPSYPSGT